MAIYDLGDSARKKFMITPDDGEPIVVSLFTPRLVLPMKK